MREERQDRSVDPLRSFIQNSGDLYVTISLRSTPKEVGLPLPYVDNGRGVHLSIDDFASDGRLLGPEAEAGASHNRTILEGIL